MSRLCRMAGRIDALRAVALLLVAGGVWIGAEPVWLALKGRLAGVLIARAWQAHLDDGQRHRPWEWADTWPVARLVVPRLGVERIVLAGASGSTLAFGPGHLDGTAAPDRPGTSAVAGHRDGAFRFLGRLRCGDRVWLETAAGATPYRVRELRVVDEHDGSALAPVAGRLLVLITCHPVGGLTATGERYLVLCEPEAPVSPTAPARRPAGRGGAPGFSPGAMRATIAGGASTEDAAWRTPGRGNHDPWPGGCCSRG